MIVRQRYNTPSIDQQFEQLTRSLFDGRHSGPAMRGSWVDDEYVLTVDLPGVPADAVTVEVVGDQLHLAVEHDEVTFDRSLRLHNTLDGDKVSARHVDGRLTVRIGQIDKPAARRVEIDTSADAPAIEASSEDDDS